MLKKLLIGTFAAVLIVAIGTAACSVFNVQAAGMGAAQAAGNGNGNGGNGQGGADKITVGTSAGNGLGYSYKDGSGTSILAIPASDLSVEEKATLAFMLEEEKLARDVYNKLYDVWGLPAFQNIAASEQNHMDQITLLFTRYNLTSAAQTPGIFTDPKLQELYSGLVAQGSLSVIEAIKVGGAIEEIDILDLQSRLAETDNADIRQVFSNLMDGSYNHLRAFANTYGNQTGEAYTAQYLSAEVLSTILNGSAGNGNGRPAWAGGYGGGGKYQY